MENSHQQRVIEVWARGNRRVHAVHGQRQCSPYPFMRGARTEEWSWRADGSHGPTIPSHFETREDLQLSLSRSGRHCGELRSAWCCQGRGWVRSRLYLLSSKTTVKGEQGEGPQNIESFETMGELQIFLSRSGGVPGSGLSVSPSSLVPKDERVRNNLLASVLEVTHPSGW